MLLKNIAGTLIPREPHVGLNIKDKIIYIAYYLLRQPQLITHNRHIPAPESVIIDCMRDRLIGYGFDINNMNGWKLYIDARDDYWMPHEDIPKALEYLESIFGLDNIYIFTNSIFDTETTKYNVECHPSTCANLYGYYDDLIAKSIDFSNVSLTKHFIALARRPTKKRVLFVKELLDTFNDSVRASCGVVQTVHTRTILMKSPKNIIGKTDTNTISNPIPKVIEPSFQELFAPYKYPLEIEEGPVGERQQHLAFDNKFFSCMVNIVCETMENDTHPVNLSEKTFKAFAWHQIPIWHASPGTVNEVRKLGFDLFDDIIDHSYDNITDYDERKNKVINELKLFKNKFKTLEELTKLRQQILDRFTYNNRLLSTLVEKERDIDVKNLYRYKMNDK